MEEQQGESEKPEVVGLQSIISCLDSLREEYPGRILIVDDEPLCIFGLSQVMSNFIDIEKRLDEALSGEKAIETVRKSYQLGFHYDIIFMDICLRGIDGFETTRQIRSMLVD